MNIGITLARRKGGIFEVLVTPEVPFSEQRRNFRHLRAQLTGFEQVELWSSSSGRVKHYRFKSKVVAPVVPTAPAKTVAAPAAPVGDLGVTNGDAPSVPAKAPRPAKAAKPAKVEKPTRKRGVKETSK